MKNSVTHPKGPENDTDRSWWIFAPLVSTFLFLIFGFHFPDSRTWGFHHLSFFPSWLSVVFLIFSIACLIPRCLEFIGSRLVSLAKWIEHPRWISRTALISILLLSGALLFIVFAIPYSLLGDSYFIITEVFRDITTGARKMFFGHSLLGYPVYVWLPSLIARTFHISQIQDIFIYYDAVFGMSYLMVVLYGAHKVADSTRSKLLLSILLLGLGGIVFFFGYVERYTGYFVTSAALLLSLFYSLHAGKSPRLPAILFVTCLAFHYTAIAYLPGLALVYLLKKYDAQHDVRIKRFVIFSWPIITLTASLLYILIRIFEMHPFFAILIPFTSQEAEYTLLSWEHLVDVANEIFLVSGIAAPLMIGTLIRTNIRNYFSDIYVLLFITISLCLFLVMFFSSPFFGLARDWDIHAVLGLSVAMTTFSLLRVRYSSTGVNNMVLGAIAGWSLIITSSWILVNINEDSAISRYRVLLKQDESLLYPDHALVGYENLRKYYSLKGLHTLESPTLRRMIQIRSYPWDFKRFQELYSEDKRNIALHQDLDMILGLLVLKSDDSLNLSIIQGSEHTDSSEYVADQWATLILDAEHLSIAERLRRCDEFISQHPGLPQGFFAKHRLLSSNNYSLEFLPVYLAIWNDFTRVSNNRPVLSAFLAKHICERVVSIYMLNKQYDSALVWLDRTEALDNRNPAVFDYKGQALMLLKDFSGAEEQYMKAIALDDSYLRTYYNLAYLYYHYNVKLDRAIEFITFYISADLDQPAKDQANKLLRALTNKRDARQ